MSITSAGNWTRPTTGYWQTLDSIEAWRARMSAPFRYDYPVLLPDRQVLALPIRALPSLPSQPNKPAMAVASLIANQASFEVAAHLAHAMTALARPLRPEVVIGLPTLGMVFAPAVAQALGHARWVPLGYSRKFWYVDDLATSISSITTPGAGKPVFLDPNQLSLLHGKRVLVVDDAISSGRTTGKIWDFLELLGVEVAGFVVAMRQGQQWRESLGAPRAQKVWGVFDSPLLELRADGWWPQIKPAPAV